MNKDKFSDIPVGALVTHFQDVLVPRWRKVNNERRANVISTKDNQILGEGKPGTLYATDELYWRLDEYSDEEIIP